MTADTIQRLVIFGATGDLAGRHLLPALARLLDAGQLPAGFEVVGAAREPLDDDRFRRLALARLDRHADDVSTEARSALTRALRYLPVDLADPASVATVVQGGSRPVAVYLALPPASLARTWCSGSTTSWAWPRCTIRLVPG